MGLNNILEVAAPVAPIFSKYLCDTVKKWWDQRHVAKDVLNNEATVANLLKEVEDLKNRIEATKGKEVSSEDVSALKEKASKVESLGRTMNEDVFSVKSMNGWADTLDVNQTIDSDAEGLVGFYVNMLRKANDNAVELGLKRAKKQELLELISALQVNRDEFLRWSKKIVIYNTPGNQGILLEKKYVLSDTLLAARESLREL